MRHRVADKKFNRDTNARKALLLGLLRNLIERGHIVTTVSKAKVLKRLADKTVYQAKDDSLASRRELHKIFGKRDAVSTLVERVAPAMADRNSGFVKITPMGNRRGDNTAMAKIEFVVQAESVGSLKSGKVHAEPVKKAKPAAKAEKAEKKAAPAKKEVKTEKKVAAKTKAAKKMK
jgi:large subunit ribosomal protein L17